MEPHWKEVVPGDEYIVSVDGPLNEGDERVLTLLYQPLIGPISTSLYFTLRNQIGKNQLSSEPVTHYFLMSMLDLGLAEIYGARMKLEAIGLMETFVKDEENRRSFIYVLKSPLSPHEFFSDPILPVFLYQKTGKKMYERIFRFFADKRMDVSGYEEVTRSFQDVFTPVPLLERQSNHLEQDRSVRLPQKSESGEIEIHPEDFDFQLLISSLSENFVSKKTVIQQREIILKLAFLYNINPVAMADLITDAAGPDKELDLEKLRVYIREWYEKQTSQSLPRLVDKIQPPLYRTSNDQPTTEEEKLIHYFETVSPRQYLEDVSGGAEPAVTDLKLIEDIMINQKLQPGVVNVLIDYCMRRSDMKLNRSFVEKIASHWARKGVKTVKQAMQLAKEEHRKYLEWQKNKDKKGYKKPIRSEKVPEWFENRPLVQEEEDRDMIDLEEEKRKLKERLQKYKK